MLALWQNELMQCGYFDTTRKGNHFSFLDETMRSFGDKKLRKMRFFRHYFAPVWRRAKRLLGACHVTPRLPVKFCPNRFLFAGVIPEKVISYDHTICIRHIINLCI